MVLSTFTPDEYRLTMMRLDVSFAVRAMTDAEVSRLYEFVFGEMENDREGVFIDSDE